MQSITQVLENNRPPTKPDGLDVFRGLDAAIKTHAKSMDDVAASIRVAVKDSNTLETAMSGAWWIGAANGIMVGVSVGIVIALLLTLIFARRPQQ